MFEEEEDNDGAIIKFAPHYDPNANIETLRLMNTMTNHEMRRAIIDAINRLNPGWRDFQDSALPFSDEIINSVSAQIVNCFLTIHPKNDQEKYILNNLNINRSKMSRELKEYNNTGNLSEMLKLLIVGSRGGRKNITRRKSARRKNARRRKHTTRRHYRPTKRFKKYSKKLRK